MDFKITADFKEFDKFVNFTRKKAIGIMKRAMRDTLNTQAFSSLRLAKKVTIDKAMPNSRTRINKNVLKVEKATRKAPFSIFGASNKTSSLQPYDAHEKIEKGEKEKNKYIPTVDGSRKGSIRNKIPQKKRLSSLRKRIPVRNKRTLRSLSLMQRKRPFEIQRKFSKLSPGIYEFGEKIGRGVAKLPRYEIIKLRTNVGGYTKPKQYKWMDRAVKGSSNATLTSRMFKNNIDRQLGFAMRKKFRR